MKTHPAKMYLISPVKYVTMLAKVSIMYTLIKLSAVDIIYLLFSLAEAQMLFNAYFYLKKIIIEFQ